MFNKRGQFFLIAALVISGILISFATFYTTSQSPKDDTSLYDLSSEINYENAQVIDQGVFTESTQDQINNRVSNLTNYYALKNPTTDFTILVGANDQIILIQCLDRNTGTVSAGTGGSSSGTSISDNRCRSFSAPRASTTTPGAVGDVVTITTSTGASITIPVSPAQNSYIVLQSSSGNQQYTALSGFPSNNQYRDCSGTEPRDSTGSGGAGIIKGGERYPIGYTPTTWTYVPWSSTWTTTVNSPTFTSIGACKWTCNYISTPRYVRDGTTNHCTLVATS